MPIHKLQRELSAVNTAHDIKKADSSQNIDKCNYIRSGLSQHVGHCQTYITSSNICKVVEVTL